MTRETKLGMVVSSSFLILLGGVLGRRLLQEEGILPPQKNQVVAEVAVTPIEKKPAAGTKAGAEAAPKLGDSASKLPPVVDPNFQQADHKAPAAPNPLHLSNPNDTPPLNSASPIQAAPAQVVAQNLPKSPSAAAGASPVPVPDSTGTADAPFPPLPDLPASFGAEGDMRNLVPGPPTTPTEKQKALMKEIGNTAREQVTTAKKQLNEIGQQQQDLLKDIGNSVSAKVKDVKTQVNQAATDLSKFGQDAAVSKPLEQFSQQQQDLLKELGKTAGNKLDGAKKQVDQTVADLSKLGQDLGLGKVKESAAVAQAHALPIPGVPPSKNPLPATAVVPPTTDSNKPGLANKSAALPGLAPGAVPVPGGELPPPPPLPMPAGPKTAAKPEQGLPQSVPLPQTGSEPKLPPLSGPAEGMPPPPVDIAMPPLPPAGAKPVPEVKSLPGAVPPPPAPDKNIPSVPAIPGTAVQTPLNPPMPPALPGPPEMKPLPPAGNALPPVAEPVPMLPSSQETPMLQGKIAVPAPTPGTNPAPLSGPTAGVGAKIEQRASNPALPPVIAKPAPLAGQPKVRQATFSEDRLDGNTRTLEALSKKHFGDERYAPLLAEFNRSLDPGNPGWKQNPPVLREGQTIAIASVEEMKRWVQPMQSSAVPAPTPGPAPIVQRPALPQPRAAAPVVPPQTVAAVPPKLSGNGSVYVVQGNGEMLFEIARRFLGDGRRWSEIYRLNPQIQPEQLIPPGTQLRLPVTSSYR